ncbi:hypothetical protein PIB30_108744 [Stylosanthes scabra]|uniref:Uncharacterized protein n=1 Tax=Stylosanthes scabra TaxID=79078 RepID=A0ABU6U1X5_9FABA|nr:hypothetical protein [Stylosanthes scabra]
MFANLHRRRLDWSFRVYVKRIFEHRFSGNEGFTLEMVLQDSEVVPVQEPSFPLYVFNFKSFPDLLSAEHLDESEMFDLKVVEEFRDILMAGETSTGARITQVQGQSGSRLKLLHLMALHA